MKKKQYTHFDAVFTAKIDAWQPLARGFIDFFEREQFDALNIRERNFSADERKVVFLTFENRFAPLGGLAAVMRFMPAGFIKYGGNTIALTPHYGNIPKVKEALEDGLLELIIDGEEFCMSSYRGTVSCYRNTDTSVATYYIAVDGRFTADQNPYSYCDSNDILDDSLAFCAAVPFVLARLGVTKDILFHAHEWQTAPVAVTSKIAVLGGVLENARTVLTLHNSFDHGIGAEKKKLFFGKNMRGDTVLQCTIPLLNGPLTTVSTPFARELCADPLQRAVFTDHLQNCFAENPPIGIENGMFGRPYLQYTYGSLSRARRGDFSALLKQKALFRGKMHETAAEMASYPGVIGKLRLSAGDDNSEAGAKRKCIDNDRPILFMSGRLDLMQKGFDVIFRAFQKMPAGKMGLIFCPSSAEASKNSEALTFFREIAEERFGDIVIWPFRISGEDYNTILSGSSFLLMPSFYEPFGAATEGFMHGTPVIARSTGGLSVQVRPYGADGDGSTGILYREPESYEQACRDWPEILGLPVGERIRVSLYQSMVNEAQAALAQAANIFADGRKYGEMMLNGMESLRDFSWDAAIWKYRRVYDAASRRGFFDN